jgi:DNA-binding XRE family transcriptional regulator
MTRNFRELEKRMPKSRLVRAKARAKEMMAEMLLSEIRQEVGLTQAKLAKRLRIKQPSLAKLEKGGEMQIGTLRRIIRALGGNLELVAHLPGGEVRINQFSG